MYIIFAIVEDGKFDAGKLYSVLFFQQQWKAVDLYFHMLTPQRLYDATGATHCVAWLVLNSTVGGVICKREKTQKEMYHIDEEISTNRTKITFGWIELDRF